MKRRRSRHPGLHSIMEKLCRGASLTTKEVAQLQRQLITLRRPQSDGDEEFAETDTHADSLAQGMLPGHATREGGERLSRRHAAHSQEFYREAQDMVVSSLGIGTYSGAMDAATDSAYAMSVHAAVRRGVNVIDTSLNYRNQRSERAVAAALHRFFNDGAGKRDEIVVCTKGGYLVPDAITEGTLETAAIAGGLHSIAPAFIADQLERSRRNLALETIDVYYLHNPESQLEFVSKEEFIHRIRVAFVQLERAVADGAIRYYGTATWDGYREGTLSLRTLTRIAHEIAGDLHHFRFVQLPFNLGMQEARTCVGESGDRFFESAAELGMTVIASASILQGRLSSDLPGDLAGMMPGLDSDAQRAIQFTRSTPGIASALVGMRKVSHVEENSSIARVPPLTASEYHRVCAAIQ